jgi:hypothetical protein
MQREPRLEYRTVRDKEQDRWGNDQDWIPRGTSRVTAFLGKRSLLNEPCQELADPVVQRLFAGELRVR